VKQTVIKRLFQSFNELERAIHSAKHSLEKKEGTPSEVLERIGTYEEILEKQRNLASALCGHAYMGNWHEVSRHVQLINGLSAMIRDDAREILSGFRPTLSRDEKEVMLT